MKRRLTDEQLESTKNCIAGANCNSCKANHKSCDTADDLIRALSSDLLYAVETIREMRKFINSAVYTNPSKKEKANLLIDSTKEYE